MAEIAVVVAPVVEAAREAQVVSVVAAAAVKRRRPVVTAATSVADFSPAAIARSGQEDAIAVGTSNLVTFYTVLRSPSPSALFT